QVAHVGGPEAPGGAGSAGARGAEAAGERSEATDLVVLLALVGVTEDVVGRADLLEAILRAGVGVRVVLLGQLAVGARDLLVGGRRHDSQHLVVILLVPLPLGGHVLRSPPDADHGRSEHAAPPAI